MKEIDTLNFSIGEDFGKLITTIAQEKITEELDLKRGLKTIEDSLIGITEKQAFDILVERTKLSVDVKTQEVIAETGFKAKDILGFKRNQLDSLAKDASILRGVLVKTVIANKNKYIYIDADALSDYFLEDSPEAILDIVESDYSEIGQLYRVIDDLIKRYFKIFNAIRKIEEMTALYYPDDNIDEISLSNKILELRQDLLSPKKGNTLEQVDLAQYLDTVTKIEIIKDAGIAPVDIMDKYNAGWLSPDGVYYGMNGHIANMLHIELANAMQDEGIIPKELEDVTSPDSWLEVNGWVKQHDNWILYAGYERSFLGEPDVPITEKQIDILYKFGQKCHLGVLSLGFSQTRISAVNLPMIDPIMFKTKWFAL